MKKISIISIIALIVMSSYLLQPQIVGAARTVRGIIGVYNAIPFTLSDGEGSALSTDENGNLKVVLADGTFQITPNIGEVDYSFKGDTDTGMNLEANDELGFYTGGVERLTINSDGNVILQNNTWLAGRNNADTNDINMFKTNTSDEIEVGGTLISGSFEFTEDSGMTTLVDMPVSATPVAGTEEGYYFKVDGNNIFSIQAEADSSGGIQSERVVVENDIWVSGMNNAGTDFINMFKVNTSDEMEVGTALVTGAYGEGYFYNNTVATVIETADTPIAMFGVAEGLCNGAVFDAGGTGAITAFADGTGKVNVSSTAHGLSSGDIITIRGTTNYNGVFAITLIDANSFSIVDTWVSNDGASDWMQPDSLIVSAGKAGVYRVSGHISISPSSAGTFLWMMYNKTTPLVKSAIERKFPTNDLGGGAYSFLTELAVGDKIWVSIQSDNTADIICKHGGMRINKIN